MKIRRLLPWIVTMVVFCSACCVEIEYKGAKVKICNGSKDQVSAIKEAEKSFTDIQQPCTEGKIKPEGCERADQLYKQLFGRMKKEQEVQQREEFYSRPGVSHIQPRTKEERGEAVEHIVDSAKEVTSSFHELL